MAHPNPNFSNNYTYGHSSGGAIRPDSSRGKLYKAAWDNYSGWTKDTNKKFDRSIGMERARAAQRGVKRDSSAWGAIEDRLEGKRTAELEELSEGATAEELTNRMNQHASNLNLSISGMRTELHRLRSSTGVKYGGYANRDEYTEGNPRSGQRTYGPQVEGKWNINPHGAYASEHRQRGSQIGSLTSGIESAQAQYDAIQEGGMEEYYTNLFGESDAEEVDVEADAETAAREAASGSTALAMGVGFDDDEDKKANIWI